MDGLTFDGIRSGDGMPLIQISDDNPTGTAVIALPQREGAQLDRHAAIAGRGEPRRRPRPTPKTQKGVPVYLHDYFGPGRHAKVVSTKTQGIAARSVWTIAQKCR